MSEKEFNKLFSQNLKYYLEKNNLSQAELANRLNVSATSVSYWCQGLKTPRMDKVDAICSIFSCRRSDLMTERKLFDNHTSSAITINVLGRVAAGIPIEAITDIIDTEEIAEEMARTGDFFGLKITGDSMEPRIYNGDVVIVRKQDDADTGDIVIAMVNGDDAVCKRLKKYDGGLALLSLNSKYEPMMYSNDDVIHKPVRIIGKVVELRGKL